MSFFRAGPGALQTVQRAEFGGAILVLQAFWPGHFGVLTTSVSSVCCSASGSWLLFLTYASG